jgi:hydroxymethylpyrimidine/phosphomethylpyrimidine kinase
VLSIAGSDPSGGAGIQADLKTFESLGVEGCAVPVALTVQNSRGVIRSQMVAAGLVAEQLEAVLSDIDVRAVKIGMLGDAENVRAVAAGLRRHPPPFVVLDPVIRSTSGATLLTDDGVDALRTELLPLVTLLTPNVAEAGVLEGAVAPATVAEVRRSARRLRSLGVPYVVVTGGHLSSDEEVVDVLADERGEREMRAPRARVSRTHGTGCRFSSAVAAFVALGAGLDDACARAQRYVGDWLREERQSE